MNRTLTVMTLLLAPSCAASGTSLFATGRLDGDVESLRVAFSNTWIEDRESATLPIEGGAVRIPTTASSVTAFHDVDGNRVFDAWNEPSMPCRSQGGLWVCSPPKSRLVLRHAAIEAHEALVDAYLTGDEWTLSACTASDGECVEPESSPRGLFRVFSGCPLGGDKVIRLQTPTEQVEITSTERDMRAPVVRVRADRALVLYDVEVDSHVDGARVLTSDPTGAIWMDVKDADVTIDHGVVSVAIPAVQVAACSRTEGCSLWLQAAEIVTDLDRPDLRVDRVYEVDVRLDGAAS